MWDVAIEVVVPFHEILEVAASLIGGSEEHTKRPKSDGVHSVQSDFAKL